MLYIDIATSETRVDRIRVRNMGHPDTGHRPTTDDLRLYRWEADGRRAGTVKHHRKNGAIDLTRKVLDHYQVLIELEDIYKPEGVDIWMNAANQMLAGRKPMDLINEGRAHEVLALIAALGEGVVM